jgi:ATP-binding cassette subfamily B protein
MNRAESKDKFHVLQHDESDCGIACILTVLRFFGGDIALSQLRSWSGTSLAGSTMLGLQQAALKTGIQAEGFEADLSDLKTLENPAILHVINEQGLNHFVVCFGYQAVKDSFEISDPAKSSIQWWESTILDKKWESRSLLLLSPTASIQGARRSNPTIHQFKWLYRFAKIDFDILFVSFAIGVLISILGLSVAVFSQKLIDQILPQNNLIKLSLGSCLLMLLLILRSGLTYIRQLFLTRQTRDFNVRMLSTFYGTLLYLPKSFFDSRKTGELISRMNDTTRIQQTVANVFTNFTLELVIVLISLAGLFYYHIGLGWIASLWLPLFIWIVTRYQKTIIESQRQVMIAGAVNESNYIDTIQGNGAIKVANKETLFIDQTNMIYSFLQDKIFQLGIISNKFNFLVQLSSSVFIVGIIFYGSWLVLHSSFSTGVVIAVIQLISMMMVSATHIASINISLQETRVALERMEEFSSLEPEYNKSAESSRLPLERFESLRIEKASFRYIGRPLIFRDLSLEIRKGEIIVLQGESGGGKSTLLQIIQGFYALEEGTILVNNTPLNQYAVPAWRNLLGVVPQQVKLFNKSLIENILWHSPDEQSLLELKRFAKKYGFDTFFDKFPNGYETMLGEDGVNISGGQQQIVGLARALYHQPQLLILDESTSAMDYQAEQKIFNLLTQLKKEMGIILVSHREKTAAIADRLYKIDAGQCILVPGQYV